MTPSVGWREVDYYRASRRARRLGESQLAQQQIQGVLDEADAGAVGLVEPANRRLPLSAEAGSTQNNKQPRSTPSKSALRGQGGKSK